MSKKGLITKQFVSQLTINYSPRKARLIADHLRGMNVAQALEQLSFMNKGKAYFFTKLLKNACSNLDITLEEQKNFVISRLIAEPAQTYYRIEPRARGSAFRIRKRYSRLKISLTKN